MSSIDNRTITRIRTYHDDLARARGGTVSKKHIPKQHAPEEALTAQPPVKAATVPTHDQPLAAPNTTRRHSTSITAQKPAQRQINTESANVAPVHTPEKRSDTVHDELSRDLAAVETKPIVAPEPTTPTNSIESEGNIVTDTKREKFRLIPAIMDALRNWLFEKKTEIEERRKPQHTVAAADTRADVIKRAATGGALAPRDDHAVVRERLRHVPRTRSTSNELVIKRADAIPEPTWTHTDDEEMPAGTPEPAPAPAQPSGYPSVPHTQPTTPETVQTPPRPRIAEPQKTHVDVETPVPKRAPASKRRHVVFMRIRRYLAIVGIGAFASALGVGLAVWLFAYFTSAPGPAQEVRTAADTYIESSETADVRFTTDRDEAIAVFATAVRASAQRPLVEFVPRIQTVDGERDASITEIRSTLMPSAPGTFVRAVHDIGTGTYRSSPFVILKVESFDTALGGMLAWERALPVDFGSFFGNVPRAQTAYTDIVHANRDMRVFLENGDDRIVYTFVDRETILISTDRTTVADLAPRIR